MFFSSFVLAPLRCGCIHTLHLKLEQRYKDMYFFEKILPNTKRNAF